MSHKVETRSLTVDNSTQADSAEYEIPYVSLR
jgi:hypothetical protein